MYLIDTNIISELRKRKQANLGVLGFFNQAKAENSALFLSAISVGELHRGVALLRHRGDTKQANTLQQWLEHLISSYTDQILTVDHDIACIWAQLRTPHHENAIDKLIAATALCHGLTVVTRNEKDFIKTGVVVLNPFKD